MTTDSGMRSKQSDSLFGGSSGPEADKARMDVLRALEESPRSSRELGVSADFLRALEATHVIALDADRFPDRHVPGNPLIARLPGDARPWPGWSGWNV